VLTLVLGGSPDGQGQPALHWLEEMRAALEYLLREGPVEGVWLAGFSMAGTVALCLAGLDERVRGVAALAASADPHSGPVAQLDLSPVELIARVPPRPVLLVHGADDDVVPLMEARVLADAAEGQVDFRVLAGAGHGLTYDPRAVAILLGWMDRQAF
jgi:pimeloyl-ACP methyl ester carboxylesterase